MENKDIRITLQYTLEEINHLLTLLGALPFHQSATMIDNIRLQAVPQIPVLENPDGNQVDTGGNPA